MSDDLVSRLRGHAKQVMPYYPEDICSQAAALLEFQAKVLREAEASYLRAVESRTAWRARAEKAESALAEAVEVMRPFAAQADAWPQIPDNQAMMTSNGEDLSALDMPMSALRAARAFVKEHGSDSSTER